MSDLDPIEIKLVLNSKEAINQFREIVSGAKNLDTNVEETTQKFNKYTEKISKGSDASDDFSHQIKGLGQNVLKTGGDLEKIGDLLGDFVGEIVQTTDKTKVLTIAKKLWSAVNLRVASTLGISTAAAQALTATLTLGLSVAVIGLIALFKSWQLEHDEIIESEKKMAGIIANTAAESIVNYKGLQAQFNELGNDMKAKEKFIEANKDKFDDLGISVTSVAQAEKLFVTNSAAFVNALMERAKAAAATEIAIEKYKEILQDQADFDRIYKEKNTTLAESFLLTLKNGPGNIFGKSEKKKREEEIKDKEDYVNKIIKIGEKANTAEKLFLKKAGQIPNGKVKTKTLSTSLESSENDDKYLAARFGSDSKKYSDHHKKLLEEKIKFYSDDKKEAEKYRQELRLFEASSEKRSDDDAEKSAKEREKKAETQRKKEEAAEKAHNEKIKSLWNQINKAKSELSNSRTADTDEIAKIDNKFDALIKKAKDVKAGAKAITEINLIRESAKSDAKYGEETKNLLKTVNEQKDLYAAYESFKTNIAKTEFAKRNNINLQEFGSFSDILDSEIKKLTEKGKLTAKEAERLKSLQDLKTSTDNDKNNKSSQDLDKAAQDTITYSEKIEAIKKEYGERAISLQKITDVKLRNAKLAENEKQKQDAINSANAEFYVKTSVYERMSQNLIGITKRELAVRIASLEEYLNKAKEFLNQEQTAFIESEIKKAKSIQSPSNVGVRENALLVEKKRLLAEIERKGKLNIFDPQDAVDLENINQELKKTVALKAQAFSNVASELAGGFHDLASAIGDSNEGLSSTLDTVGDILGVAGDAAGAFAKFASGDIIGGITGVFKTISGIFNIAKKSRESEKKAQEEIKKRQEEQLQAALDYNATLRQRMIDETKLNDLYKSRVDNIKEEMAARKNALADNLKDQQNLFNKLLGMQTVIGQYTEKYGGFLGIGKKTRVVDVNASLSSLLGVNAGTTFTDDLFNRLEQLNASNPLTGDAKTAYEQLKKLRDEYGSIADAQEELQRRLKDAITGTTAQTLADSIREGLKSGKKSFADFADDIEGFLRDAILAGISAKIIEPQIQQLQDALAVMLGDGILSADERAQFQAMYLAIVNQSQEYMDLINQAGVNVTGANSSVNSLQGAIKGMNQESADIISGQFGGMRLAQLETNQTLKSGSAAILEKTSQQIEIQMNIEKNTKRTADNTEKLYDVNDNVVKVVAGQDKYYNALQAAGIIK